MRTRPSLLATRLTKRLMDTRGFTWCPDCHQLVAPNTMDQHRAGHSGTLAQPSVKVGKEVGLDARD